MMHVKGLAILPLSTKLHVVPVVELALKAQNPILLIAILVLEPDASKKHVPNVQGKAVMSARIAKDTGMSGKSVLAAMGTVSFTPIKTIN